MQAELNKIKRRRENLYDDLENFLEENDISKFNPSVGINSNDKKHLSQFLAVLSKVNKKDVLEIFDKMRRLIEEQIRVSLSLVQRPLIPISSDLNCIQTIGTLVTNQCDAEILVDALCWAEDNHHSTIVFCTLDWTDVLVHRIGIYSKICRIRGCTRTEVPLEIKGLDEI